LNVPTFVTFKDEIFKIKTGKQVYERLLESEYRIASFIIKAHICDMIKVSNVALMVNSLKLSYILNEFIPSPPPFLYRTGFISENMTAFRYLAGPP
jgi:hypothetical protein